MFFTAVLALVLSSTVIEGTFRITIFTDIENHSGTDYTLKFKIHGSSGTTNWIDTSHDFWDDYVIGRVDTADYTVASVGDIQTVQVWLDSNLVHEDDWKGWKVIVSDSTTGKTYQFTPGWIDTDQTRTYTVHPLACEDKMRNPSTCTCGTSSDAQGAFNMAKTNYELCRKKCGYCFPATRRDQPSSDGGETGDREGEPEESGNDDLIAAKKKHKTKHDGDETGDREGEPEESGEEA